VTAALLDRLRAVRDTYADSPPRIEVLGVTVADARAVVALLETHPACQPPTLAAARRACGHSSAFLEARQYSDSDAPEWAIIGLNGSACRTTYGTGPTRESALTDAINRAGSR